MTTNNKPAFEKFAELDYMTQRTIQYEFPTIFPECSKDAIQTESIEHFKTRTFSMSEFYGGFVLVIMLLGVVSAFI